MAHEHSKGTRGKVRDQGSREGQYLSNKPQWYLRIGLYDGYGVCTSLHKIRLQLAGKDTNQHSYAKGKTDLAERIEDAATDTQFRARDLV
jgi:hypothetical protein